MEIFITEIGLMGRCMEWEATISQAKTTFTKESLRKDTLQGGACSFTVILMTSIWGKFNLGSITARVYSSGRRITLGS
jgi:hypothetical protein